MSQENVEAFKRAVEANNRGTTKRCWRIVALGHVRGRGRASGAELDSPISFVAEFRDCKVFRMSDYLDSREALKAAGLSE